MAASITSPISIEKTWLRVFAAMTGKPALDVGLGGYGACKATFRLVGQGWTGMYTLVIPSLSAKFIKNSQQKLPV